MIVKNPKKENCVFCGTHDGVVKRKCRCKDNRIEIKSNDLKKLDELVIGDFIHLERTHGTNNREWCLIVTNEKGQQLNLTLHENKGKVKYGWIYENEWEGKRFPSEWGVK